MIQTGVLVAQHSGQGKRRIVRGLGHADIGVGRRHQALARGDIGAALQQVRRQVERNVGNFHDQRRRRQ